MITAILENKRVISLQKDIKDVLNTLEIYDNLERLIAKLVHN